MKMGIFPLCQMACCHLVAPILDIYKGAKITKREIVMCEQSTTI